MKLHQEEAMMPVPRAADPWNLSIRLFPALSDPMLVPKCYGGSNILRRSEYTRPDRS